MTVGSWADGGQLVVFLGDGTFQTAVPHEFGGQFPGDFIIADMNGDGKPDLVVVSQTMTGTDDSLIFPDIQTKRGRTSFAITSIRDGWISSGALSNKNQAMAGRRTCIQRTSTAACKSTSTTSKPVVLLRWSTGCGITRGNTAGYWIEACPATRRMERLKDM